MTDVKHVYQNGTTTWPIAKQQWFSSSLAFSSQCSNHNSIFRTLNSSDNNVTSSTKLLKSVNSIRRNRREVSKLGLLNCLPTYLCQLDLLTQPINLHISNDTVWFWRHRPIYSVIENTLRGDHSVSNMNINIIIYLLT